MGVCEGCGACWVLLGLMRMTNTAYNQAENCMELELDGLGPSDNMVRIEENTYINIKAHIQWQDWCDKNENHTFHIKISQTENQFLIDLCKFIISKDCKASDTLNGDSQCRCLSNRLVQFYKKVKRSDSRNYTWTWANSKNPHTEKQREIFISFTSTPTEKSSSTTEIAASTCAVFGVVVAAAVGYIVRRRRCGTCWVLLGLMRMTNTASNQAENCMELEFDGLGPSDNMVRIEENTYINLTAHIRWQHGCDNDTNHTFHVKISQTDNQFLTDECKFIISRDCNASDTSNNGSQCRCLSNRLVQFYKNVKRSDNRKYTWTWVNTKKPETEKRREIFISFTNTPTEESSDTTPVAASTCAVVGVVVAVAVGYFLRKRNVLTCCRSCCVSSSGAAADCNKQKTRQVVDTKDVSSSHVDDRYYSDNLYEDMSCLDDPRYLHYKQKDTSQRADNIYDHLSC